MGNPVVAILLFCVSARTLFTRPHCDKIVIGYLSDIGLVWFGMFIRVITIVILNLHPLTFSLPYMTEISVVIRQ